jgi:hypothetical protein
MTKRYQRGNQNLYIEEEQTLQWPKDTKGVIWPLCCLFFFNIQILITPLVSFGHCVVCPSIYWFWLPTMTKRYQRGNQNLYIEEGQTTQWPTDTKGVIRISILKDRQHNDQKIPKGDIQILITPLVSFGHCVVCSSSIYGFWLPLWLPKG